MRVLNEKEVTALVKACLKMLCRRQSSTNQLSSLYFFSGYVKSGLGRLLMPIVIVYDYLLTVLLPLRLHNLANLIENDYDYQVLHGQSNRLQ